MKMQHQLTNLATPWRNQSRRLSLFVCFFEQGAAPAMKPVFLSVVCREEERTGGRNRGSRLAEARCHVTAAQLKTKAII